MSLGYCFEIARAVPSQQKKIGWKIDPEMREYQLGGGDPTGKERTGNFARYIFVCFHNHLPQKNTYVNNNWQRAPAPDGRGAQDLHSEVEGLGGEGLEIEPLVPNQLTGVALGRGLERLRGTNGESEEGRRVASGWSPNILITLIGYCVVV